MAKESLSRYVRKNVSAEQYWLEFFPDAKWTPGSSETKVLSCFVKERTPSLCINRDTGEWYSFCAADQHGGHSIVSFEAAYYGLSYHESATRIFERYIHPTISSRKINRWQERLMKNNRALGYLQSRYIKVAIIKSRRIGWLNGRFSLPVYNEFGICTNTKLLHPKPRNRIPKAISYTSKSESRQYGSPAMLFPIEEIFKTDTNLIFVCEGEWDALVLVGLGLHAVTSTCGVKSWPTQYSHLFKNKKVVIVYDNDESGQKEVKRAVRYLLPHVRTIRKLDVPEEHGKDVTDWVKSDKRMRQRIGWLKAIRDLPIIAENEASDENQNEDKINVNLEISTSSTMFQKNLNIEALVAGKDREPYLLPKKYRVVCSSDCDGCKVAMSDSGALELEMNPLEPSTLSMIDIPKSTKRIFLLNTAGITNPKCKASLEIVSTFNVERISMIPTLDSDTGAYTMIEGFHVGHGLRTNRAYRFNAHLYPHPRNSKATFLLSDSHPINSDVETYEMDSETRKALKIFQPKKLQPLSFLVNLAEWQSRNITHILERPLLHTVVDLAYHSVASFQFNHEIVRRGMLDIMLLGDTRCGKGFVAEGLRHYYRLGEMASGENSSFAGLVGGVQQIKNNWQVTWGMIPLNHNRLVMIDEVQELHPKEISRLSRVRSEGIAEIVKIVREVTRANTRLVWLANPRNGRLMSTYNHGVEALTELIGAVEDISRFDLVLAVTTGEVASETINTVIKHSSTDGDKYPPEIARALVMWAWSRTVSQIKFTNKATKQIINDAIRLSKEYSPIIPLIQSQNCRIKLAKIAAAIAARLFSTDKNGENLIVDKEHAICARRLIRVLYNRPSFAYDLFSKTTSAATRIYSIDKVKEVITKHASDEQVCMVGLLETHRITPDVLADFVGDITVAKSLIGELVQLRCISRIDKAMWYLKNPEFVTWLREQVGEKSQIKF
jgi:hypothetical protein